MKMRSYLFATLAFAIQLSSNIEVSAQTNGKELLLVWNSDCTILYDSAYLDTFHWSNIYPRVKSKIKTEYADLIVYYGSDSDYDYEEISAHFKGIDYYNVECIIDPGKCITPYTDSLPDGMWLLVSITNGTPSLQASKNVLNYRRDGLFVSYYPNGQIEKLKRFENGFFVDTSYYYLPSGQLASSYVFGRQPSLIPLATYLYDNKGSLFSMEYFIEGNRVVLYFCDNKRVCKVVVNEKELSLEE